MTTVSLQTIAALFGGEDSLLAPVITQSSEDGTSILSFVFTAEGEIPEDGLIVTVNSNIQFRDYFAFLAERPFMIGGELVGAVFNDAGEATGFRFKMTASKALLNLRPQDNTGAPGNEQFSFTLAEGTGYTVDAAAATSTVTFYETLAAVPAPTVVPTVSLSIGETTLNEATGNSTTVTFSLSEPPPPEGILLYVKGDTVAGFDSGVPLLSEFDLFNAQITGGAFPTPDGFANGFFFKVTEQTATLTISTFKDEDLEGLRDIVLSLQAVPGYEIAADAGSVLLNIVDDENSQIQVSLTTEPAVLIESEQTVSVHNFVLSATPPAEGLVVSVVAPNIDEFDLGGIAVEGGEIVRVTPTGFDFRITAKNATIELPVANDGSAEGLEDAIFTLQDAPNYQVNSEATVGKFQIVDTPDQAPVLSVSEPNDTIAKAVDINLSATNNFVSLNSSIDFSFRNSYDNGSGGTIYVDNTEDVDLYKVVLKAGDRLKLDVDSNQDESKGLLFDSVLRIFDATGQEVAFADSVPAPDEIYESVWDAYLEFEAPTDGEYYIGVSIWENFTYDPNRPGSGSGYADGTWGAGEYNLNVSLNNDAAFVSQPTPIPNSLLSRSVKLEAVTGTYKSDFSNSDFGVINNSLVENVGAPGASVLSLTLSTTEAIPEGGLVVYVQSDSDLTEQFATNTSYGNNLAFEPFNRGGEFLGAIYDASGRATGFSYRLDAPNAIINFPVRDDDLDEEPQSIKFFLANVAGNPSTTVTVYDNAAQLPTVTQTPEVGLTISNTALVESENTETSLTFSLSEAPPPEGILVYVVGGEDAIGEFDVFAAKVTGGVLPVADGLSTGFYFRILEQTATITLPVFNSADLVEGIEGLSFELLPGVGYTVAAGQSKIDLTIADTPDAKIAVSYSSSTDAAGYESGTLIESAGTFSTHIFSLGIKPPADGITILVKSDSLDDFDLSQAEITGGTVVAVENGGFSLNITEKQATVKVPVLDDGKAEGVEIATFTIEPSDTYQVITSDERNVAKFTIYDAASEAVRAEDEGNSIETTNDVIAQAIDTELGGGNLVFKISAEVGNVPTDDGQLDQTEDVDLYKVELTAGQDLIIDIDATEIGSKLQFAQIRVFDAAGVELAKTGANSFQAAPAEVFSVFNDPYLEFTAPSAGTYYVGISQIGNDYYDPNVAGSGSGWIFPAAEILPDKYQLTLSVGPELIIDPPPVEPPVEPPVGDSTTLAATAAYYTYEGNISSRSNVRLLADKANVIGFPGRETFSFLQFDPGGLPTDLLDQEFTVALSLQHDSSLAATLIPATDDRPVSLSVYDLDAPFNSTQPGGNIADINYGENGANAIDRIEVGNDGLYNWDVTSLIAQWAIDPTNNDGLAISGFYGNVNTDDRNSYGIFHTVGSTTGQVPTLKITTLGGGSDSPQTLYGSDLSETLAGGQANDTLYGNGGGDLLLGRAGNDLIYGGSQSDMISGGSGDDLIYANGGGDVINAGSGMDTVWLGAGAATLVLNAGEGYVTVKNFQLGATQFTGGGTGLSFADSADGVKISKGDDLLAVVTWQTASTFSSNAAMIFA